MLQYFYILALSFVIFVPYNISNLFHFSFLPLSPAAGCALLRVLFLFRFSGIIEGYISEEFGRAFGEAEENAFINSAKVNAMSSPIH